MSNEIRIRVTADTSQAEKSVGGVGTLVKGILAADAVQRGFDILVGGIKSSISAAQESARVNAQLNAVLTSTGGVAGISGDKAHALADEMQRLTKYTDEEVLAAENLLLTFTNVRGQVFEEGTKAILDMSTALGQDLKSSTIQLGKALNDPIAGITALTRVGVTFNEQQKEQIKTLVESGKVMEAQKVILAELNKEFGGSATAMTPFEKKLDSLKDKYDEAQEAAGRMVINGLMRISDWVDAHEDDIEKWGNRVGKAFEVIKNHAETHLGGVIGVAKSVYGAVSSFVDLIDDVAHGRWASAWESFKSVALNVGKTMVNGLAALFGAIPNLAIGAVNKAIDAINSVEVGRVTVPKLNLPGIGNVIPGGGHNINPVTGSMNIPHVPELPTEIFDIGKALEGLAEEVDVAAPKVRSGTDAIEGLGKSSSGTKDKILTLTDALEDSIITYAEALELHLTPAQAGAAEGAKYLADQQRALDEAAFNVQKTLAKIATAFKDSDEAGKKLVATLAKESLEKLRAAAGALGTTQEEAALQLKLAHLDSSRAGFDQGNLSVTASNTARQAQLKNEIDGLEAQKKHMESLKQDTTVIDNLIEMRKRESDNLAGLVGRMEEPWDRQRAALEAELRILTAKHSLQEAEIRAADKSLLTESERGSAVEEITRLTREQSGYVRDSVTNFRDLVPELAATVKWLQQMRGGSGAGGAGSLGSGAGGLALANRGVSFTPPRFTNAGGVS